MTDTQLKRGIYNCPNCGAAATPQSVRCAYCRSSLATLVCAKCFGAVFIGMKHCPWCGEDAASGKPAEIEKGRCPRCDVEFQRINVSTKTLSGCPACGGIWVDHDTLQDICSSREDQQAVMGFRPESLPANSEAATNPKRVYIACPRCSKLMNRKQFAGCSRVVVDWCKTHGTWFDRDELRQIAQFILDGGLIKSREREKVQIEQARQNLRDERRNLDRLSRLAPESDLPTSRATLDIDLCDVFGGIWRAIRSGD